MDQSTDPDLNNENPFTSDLKNEFGGAGGASQIFKDTGRSNRLKFYAGLALLLSVGAGAFYYFTNPTHNNEDFVVADDDSEEDEMDDGSEKKSAPTQESVSETTVGEKKSTVIKSDFENASIPPETQEAKAMHESAPTVDPTKLSGNHEASSVAVTTGAIKLSTPANGTSTTYDESSARPIFQWDGVPGGTIIFSRNPKLTPADYKARVHGNKFESPRLLPGIWYWSVRKGNEPADIWSFVVKAPVKRNIKLASPSEGSILSANGGVVAWMGDTKVSYYRVEITDKDWDKPLHRFATSGTQLQIKNIKAGQYQLRIGGFSEVSGQWEYAHPISITVQ